MRPTTRTVLALLAAAPTALAQSPTPYAGRGMASGWPAGAFIENGGTMSGLLSKPPYDQASPLQLANDTAVGDPTYSTFLTQLRANLDPGNTLVIDAISSGNGVIPETNGGVPDFGGLWGAISVSVTEDSPSTRQDPGTINWFKRARDYYSQPSIGGGNGGAEIVTYYFAESDGIDTSLPGNTLLEMSRIHLGMPLSSHGDVSSWDYGIGVELGNVAMNTSVLLPCHDRIFFSVTQASAATWNAAHPGGTFAVEVIVLPNSSIQYVGHGARGADIYMVEWDWSGGPSGNGAWSDPYLYASAELLGIDGDAAGSDVDALDVYNKEGRIVFSPTIGTTFNAAAPAGEQSQLMIVELEAGQATLTATFDQFAVDQTPKALRDQPAGQAPVKVTDKVQINDITTPGDAKDEIDVVCVIDPDGGMPDEYLGIPRQRWVGEREPVHLSMCRWESTGPSTRWRGHVTGWGNLTPDTAVIRVFCKDGAIGPNGSLVPSTAWVQLGGTTRSATDESATFEVTIPDSLSALTHSFFVTLQTRNGTVTSWPVDVGI